MKDFIDKFIDVLLDVIPPALIVTLWYLLLTDMWRNL